LTAADDRLMMAADRRRSAAIATESSFLQIVVRASHSNQPASIAISANQKSTNYFWVVWSAVDLHDWRGEGLVVVYCQQRDTRGTHQSRKILKWILQREVNMSPVILFHTCFCTIFRSGQPFGIASAGPVEVRSTSIRC
jgi:hypothetical protein